MFVYGDEVYALPWQVLTLKNRIEPLSYVSEAYVAAYGPRLGNVQEFSGQMVYRPPPHPPRAKKCLYAYA